MSDESGVSSSLTDPKVVAAIEAPTAQLAPRYNPPAGSLPSSVAKTLAAANTKTVGFGGIALILVSYVVPAIAPDVDDAIRAHFRPLYAHGVIALLGGLMALLGRYRSSEPDDVEPA